MRKAEQKIEKFTGRRVLSSYLGRSRAQRFSPQG